MKVKNKLYKLTIVCIVLFFAVFVLAGCGEFSAFKELNVNDKDIPEYHEAGKAILGKPDEGEFGAIWVTLEAGEIAEEGIRKIAADYITNNSEYDLIGLRIKSGEKIYLVEYYKDAAAAEKAGSDKKFDKWPAISFEEKSE